MAESAVVDTNVLLVASAADDGSPFRPEATPVEEAALREKVLEWLREFEADSERHVVLDWDWHICGEYQNKLNLEQDYGWLAIMAKRDRNEVAWVGIDVDANGHAMLASPLKQAVTDLEDRKMVAAVIAAIADGHSCHLVNACDTDWIDCEKALSAAGVSVVHLLPTWIRKKHQSKHKSS